MGKFKTALKLMALVVVGVLLGGGVYFMVAGGVFDMKEIVFSGNTYLSEKELKAIVGQDRLSLLSPLKRIAWRLQASPWIKEARLKKEYPRLLVQVVEAEPVALLESATGLYLISDAGRMLQPIENAMPFLPVIVGQYAPGSEAFTEAVSLARAVKETGLAAEKNRVEIKGLEQGAEDLMMSVDGLDVKVGKGQYEEKILRYAELSEEIARRNIAVDYVDLRFANRVVVKAVPEAEKKEKAANKEAVKNAVMEAPKKKEASKKEAAKKR